MNITIVGVFPPFRGGIAHFSAKLASGLFERHSVRAINFTTQYPDFLFPGKTQFESGKPAADYPNTRYLSSVNPLSWLTTANLIKKQKPDLVIFKYWMSFFAPAYGIIARMIKRSTNAKILTVCHNVIPHEPQRFDKLLTTYFFKAVDNFIVMSKSVEDDLLKIIPEADYQYQPHPLYDIFGAEIESDAARSELNITAGKVILFFGFIRGYKGLDTLLEAIHLVRDKLDNFKVIVAGDCYESDQKYRDIVTNYSLEELVDLRIEFIPDQDVAKYFSAADVVVLPYKSATQSGIVPVAYQFNTPVIVTDVGGLPEIVQDGKTGYLCQNDPGSVGETINRFFNQSRSIDFRSNIKKYKQQFSWDGLVKIIEEMAA